MSPELLPALPTETHEHILSFCDERTLGRASLVSLGFLELASPFLYSHITVHGYAQLEKLFYDEPRTSAASLLDRFTSLDQRRSFTFVGLLWDRAHTNSYADFCPTRPGTSFPIAVHTLNARFHPADPDRNDYADSVAQSVLALFNPEHAYLASSRAFDQVFTLEGYDLGWTRLQTLSMDEIGWAHPLVTMDFYERLRPRSLTLIYDLDKSESVYENVLPQIVRDLAGEGQNNMSGRLPPLLHPVKEVVLHLESTTAGEGAVKELRSKLGDACLLERKEEERELALIRYEVD